MKSLLLPYEITREAEMAEPLNYNHRSRLMNTEGVYKAEISSITQLTEMEKLFHIRILDAAERQRFTFLPGQFVMVEVPGYGEVPISISGSASNRGFLELCIRRAGMVTSVLHRAKTGSRVGLRGPFGTSFPVAMMRDHHVLLIAGGLGLAPLRSAILHVTENRSDFRNVHILYGTKTPDQLLFDYQYEQWRRVDGVNLSIIVEEAGEGWTGEVGLVTKLLDRIPMEPDRTYAIVCGPPVMFKFVCNKLGELGIPMRRMFVSLERRMHCGMGKCCRCNIGSTFTCKDGPVFDYWTAINLKEAI